MINNLKSDHGRRAALRRIGESLAGVPGLIVQSLRAQEQREVIEIIENLLDRVRILEARKGTDRQ